MLGFGPESSLPISAIDDVLDGGSVVCLASGAVAALELIATVAHCSGGPMISSAYLVGNTIRFQFAIQDKATCQPVDPTTVMLLLKAPGSSESQAYVYGLNVEIKRLSRGVYAGDVTLATAGCWKWRWECAGPSDGAAEGRVDIRTSRF